MKVCVLGLGYIGLPTAVMLASAGHDVVGVDVKEEILEAVGKLVVSPHPLESDAFIIAVPTPLSPHSLTPYSSLPHCDLSYIKSAAASIAPVLRRGDLVVLESTSPPGTTQDVLAPILEEGSGLKAGVEGYDSSEGIFEGGDCIVVLTDHTQFRDLDPGGIAPLLRNKLVFDARDVLDKVRWERAGFRVETI